MKGKSEPNIENFKKAAAGFVDVFQGCFAAIHTDPIQRGQLYEYREESDFCIDRSEVCNRDTKNSSTFSDDQMPDNTLLLVEETTASITAADVANIERSGEIKHDEKKKIAFLLWPQISPKSNALIASPVGVFQSNFEDANITSKERLTKEVGLFLSEGSDGQAVVRKVKNHGYASEAGISRGDRVEVSFFINV